MNFLGHALLSPDDDEVLAGNVCADLIRGRIDAATRPGIASGIALHRSIDRYTDRHEAFKACAAWVAEPRRRYARVIVDVFFDYCLSRNWSRYRAQPLSEFVELTCRKIERQAAALPVRDRARLDRMLEGRWLGMYSSRSGIDLAFAGVARRSRFGVGLESAGDDLDRHYPAIEGAFHRLMPQLQAHAHSSVAGYVDGAAGAPGSIARGSPTA